MPKYKKTMQRSTATLHLDSIAKTMKKLLLALTVAFTVTVAHGQLNPIKNLYFNCYYQTPYNCWNLAWSSPDSSQTDTLVGYNIYRDDSLYLFTTNTSIYYDPCIGNPNATYIGFTNYNGGQFYIHVTAVYDTAHIESIYNDSINNGGCGFAIGVNENNYQQTVSLFPNPFPAQTTLQTHVPLINATLTVDNCFGQTVVQIKNLRGQTITFNRDNLVSGLYFVRLTEGNKIFTDKLIITDR